MQANKLGEAELRQLVHSHPDIAIEQTTGKIIHRWAHGGDSHWILNTEQSFGGKKYKLVDIRVTAGANYLVCIQV